MDTKALRQKVLDLAIRGKLVPQNPNDEPASVLLERIRQQKQQMVKEGKLKAKDIKNDTIIFVGEDNLHYEKFADGSVKCIEDEIPFELPEGWAWTRLGNLCAAIQYGLSNSAESMGSHKFLRITDIQNGIVNWDTVPFARPSDPDTYLLKSGDIVFARTGATVGKSFLITETPYPSVYASYLIRIRLLGNLPSEYIYQFFDSACYWSQITDKSVGVGQPNCNGTSLKELLIPLPPINEQLRIIPTVQNLLKYVTIIDTEEKALTSIATAAKAKILDLAIRGKLVPQNQNDEPASVLLERIRAEKKELIKAGKIKRDKRESVIFRGEDNSYYEKIGGKVVNIDDEIPFELPDSWFWCRLGNIGDWQTGATPNRRKPEYYEGAIPWIKTGDLNNGYITEVPEAITELALAETSVKVIPSNTVIVAMYGATIGKVGITTFESTTNQACCACCNPQAVRGKYLFYYLMSHKEVFVSMAEGGAQPNISKEKIVATLIPIPPYDEQTRITKIVEASFSILDRVEKSLS